MTTTVENPPETTRRGGVTGAGFVPGVSGNPGGRPRGLARRVRELVGDNGELIVGYMLAVLRDDRERTRDRLEAARFLADRGWGKPVQAVEIDVAPQPSLDLSMYSLEDLETMIAILEKYGPGGAANRQAADPATRNYRPLSEGLQEDSALGYTARITYGDAVREIAARWGIELSVLSAVETATA